jgi:hypothetical protein
VAIARLPKIQDELEPLLNLFQQGHWQGADSISQKGSIDSHEL